MEQHENETWYQFRIPIGSYNHKVGNIPGFQVHPLHAYVYDRFSDWCCVWPPPANQNIWRKFQYQIDTTGIIANHLQYNFQTMEG